MDEAIRKQLVPGVKVVVTQQIPARDHVWTNQTRGTVVGFEQKPTGSWFAHSKNDKLWLDRLLVRLDDGELSTLNLDDYSRVEMIGTGDPTANAGDKAPDKPGDTRVNNIP
jgi:hypothetical protein